MLIVALVLAVIGLAALVTAVVTSNELIAWVCIGASVIGVILLIVDAVRERSHGERSADDHDRDHDDADLTATTALEPVTEDYPDDDSVTEVHRTVDGDTAVTETVETDTVTVPTEGAAGDEPKRD